MDPAPLLQPLLSLPDGLLYLLLFGAALLENVAPPLPGDAVVVFGGYLTGLGRLSLPLAFLAVTAGSWGGFMIYYAAGRWLGRSAMHTRLGRWLANGQLERGEAWVRRWGLWIVLANRLLAGARSVISLVAGFAALPAAGVAGMALASAALWNVLLVGAGYAIGEEWSRVLGLLHTYDRVMLTALLALAAYALWRRWMRQQGARSKP